MSRILAAAPNDTNRKGVFVTRRVQDILSDQALPSDIQLPTPEEWDSLEEELGAKGVVVFPALCDVNATGTVRIFRKQSRIVALLDALLFPTMGNSTVVANAVKQLAD